MVPARCCIEVCSFLTSSVSRLRTPHSALRTPALPHSALRTPLVELVDEAQPLQREVGIDHVDHVRLARDDLRPAAGADYERRSSQLALELRHDPLHQADVAEHDTR